MTIRTTAAAFAAGLLGLGLAGTAGAQEILFWSTQATPSRNRRRCARACWPASASR